MRQRNGINHILTEYGQLLAAELKELRRLKDENIVPEDSYEKAKLQIFKHEAFKAAE